MDILQTLRDRLKEIDDELSRLTPLQKEREKVVTVIELLQDDEDIVAIQTGARKAESSTRVPLEKAETFRRILRFLGSKGPFQNPWLSSTEIAIGADVAGGSVIRRNLKELIEAGRIEQNHVKTGAHVKYRLIPVIDQESHNKLIVWP